MVAVWTRLCRPQQSIPDRYPTNPDREDAKTQPDEPATVNDRRTTPRCVTAARWCRRRCTSRPREDDRSAVAAALPAAPSAACPGCGERSRRARRSSCSPVRPRGAVPPAGALSSARARSDPDVSSQGVPQDRRDRFAVGDVRGAHREHAAPGEQHSPSDLVDEAVAGGVVLGERDRARVIFPRILAASRRCQRAACRSHRGSPPGPPWPHQSTLAPARSAARTGP
jgi:hypothetical protein